MSVECAICKSVIKISRTKNCTPLCSTICLGQWAKKHGFTQLLEETRKRYVDSMKLVTE